MQQKVWRNFRYDLLSSFKLLMLSHCIFVFLIKGISYFGVFGPTLCPVWVKSGKKGDFYTSHLTPNPVFPESKVLNQPYSPNTLSKLKDVLTDQHKTLQKFNFY